MEEKLITQNDILKLEIEKELEKALTLIEDAQEKMDLLLENEEEQTPENKYNNNKLTSIILKLEIMLDK